MNYMDYDLYNAVVSGNSEVMKEIGSRLSVSNQLTPTNYTVLHLASEYGNITCVQELLNSHESLLLKLNSRGETALHLAAREGHYNVAKALIDAAKSSLLQLNDLKTKSSTVLEFLIRSANVEFETALHEAVRYNHVNVVDLLVTEDLTHPHPPNKDEETPLYMASVRGYKEIITIILDNVVSPTYGGPQGRTALIAAILNIGGIQCVKLLLEKKRELIKVADVYGWTAFHYVAYNNYYTIVEDLVDADKSVAYIPDKKYNRVAIHIAAYEGCLGVMMKLLKYCPDSCDIVDGSGKNILHITVERNHKNIIRYIFENRKEFYRLLIQKDKEGNTPLHQMAKLGCYIPEVMTRYQTDWEALNGKSLTPLQVIHSVGDNYLADQEKISRTLINANANRHWDLHSIIVEPDLAHEKNFASSIDRDKELMEDYRKMRDTHMIVAALIATVALTAGFAMPGGFDGNAGSNQGSPALIRNAAFKTFMVTDTIAVLCSLSSLFIHFVTLFYNDPRKLENVALASTQLNLLSIIAMMLAFITGTYAILVHSAALAITVCVISSLFFLVVFYLLKKNFDYYK